MKIIIIIELLIIRNRIIIIRNKTPVRICKHAEWGTDFSDHDYKQGNEITGGSKRKRRVSRKQRRN